jgi:hypothetical protein
LLFIIAINLIIVITYQYVKLKIYIFLIGRDFIVPGMIEQTGGSRSGRWFGAAAADLAGLYRERDGNGGPPPWAAGQAKGWSMAGLGSEK